MPAVVSEQVSRPWERRWWSSKSGAKDGKGTSLCFLSLWNGCMRVRVGRVEFEASAVGPVCVHVGRCRRVSLQAPL